MVKLQAVYKQKTKRLAYYLVLQGISPNPLRALTEGTLPEVVSHRGFDLYVPDDLWCRCCSLSSDVIGPSPWWHVPQDKPQGCCFFIALPWHRALSVCGSYDDLFCFQFHGPNTEKNAGPAPFQPHHPAQEEKHISDVFLFQGLRQIIMNKWPVSAATLWYVCLWVPSIPSTEVPLLKKSLMAALNTNEMFIG